MQSHLEKVASSEADSIAKTYSKEDLKRTRHEHLMKADSDKGGKEIGLLSKDPGIGNSVTKGRGYGFTSAE
jgi:hypothetical protein